MEGVVSGILPGRRTGFFTRMEEEAVRIEKVSDRVGLSAAMWPKAPSKWLLAYRESLPRLAPSFLPIAFNLNGFVTERDLMRCTEHERPQLFPRRGTVGVLNRAKQNCLPLTPRKRV